MLTRLLPAALAVLGSFYLVCPSKAPCQSAVPSDSALAAPSFPAVLPIPPAYSRTPAVPMSTTETAAIVDTQGMDILTTAILTEEAITRLTAARTTETFLAVTLADVVYLTLERNLDYKIAQLNYEIAQEEVTAQKGLFDPVLSATIQASESTQQGSIFGALMGGGNMGLQGARQQMGLGGYETPLADIRRQGVEEDIAALQARLNALEAALAQGFASDYRSINRMKSRSAAIQVTEQNGLGGQIGIGYSINRMWMDPTFLNINPSYSQSAQVWIVQPVPFFRGWGPAVTLSGIRLAQRNETARAWEQRQELINQLAAVMSGYWDLVNAIYNAEVQRLSHESAKNLLRINEIRLKHEVGTEIDVWEARAGVAARENMLIMAAHAIGLAQDNLARLTRVKEGPQWKVRMIPRDPPRYSEYPVDEMKFIADAHSRPDIRQAELMRERAEIRRTVARNERMPQLNAFGQYGISGLGPSVGRSSHYLGTADYDNWAVGVDFNFPIPNTKARARARQADKLVEGSELLIEKTRDFAEFEVRKAIRDLQSARESIAVSETRIRAEREKLRGELKRYEVGMATSQDLLDYQDRLAAAQSAYIASIVAYNKAIIDLERARGTLLDSLPSLGAPTVTFAPSAGEP